VRFSFKALAVVGAILVAVTTGTTTASATAGPNIVVRSCQTGVTENWVAIHLKSGPFQCVGFTGTQNLGGEAAWSFNAGNNYGRLWYNFGYQNTFSCFGDWPNGKPSDCLGVSVLKFDWYQTVYGWALLGNVEIDGWN